MQDYRGTGNINATNGENQAYKVCSFIDQLHFAS